jgi:hypothetical protein
MTQDGDLITSPEAAIILGVSARTVHRWVEDPTHELTPVQKVQAGHHGTFLFHRADIEELKAKRDAAKVSAA